MAISRAALLAFMRSNKYAVESSVHPDGAPQSAVVGVAVSDDFEVVFDTLRDSRKAVNLTRLPRIAFVFSEPGTSEVRTVQFEGEAAEVSPADRDRLIGLYLRVFPDGVQRQSWPGLIYYRATPRWIRYSDYSVDPPDLVELDRAALLALT